MGLSREQEGENKEHQNDSNLEKKWKDNREVRRKIKKGWEMKLNS